jgi:hypothetical protein
MPVKRTKSDRRDPATKKSLVGEYTEINRFRRKVIVKEELAALVLRKHETERG